IEIAGAIADGSVLQASVPIGRDDVFVEDRFRTSAASDLRAATSPLRLAMLNPSSATGMRMAMNTSAARTSASVKALALPFCLVRLILARLKFIIQTAPGQHHRDRTLVCADQLHHLGTVFADRAVRHETNSRKPG